MSRGDIRVLVVDDSPTVRAVVRRILAKTPDLAVVGQLSSLDGSAERRLRTSPWSVRPAAARPRCASP